MNIIQESPTYFNDFNFFLLPQYNLKFTVFTNQSILHLPSFIPTPTDASPPFSSISLIHLPLNPLTCLLKQLLSLLSGSLFNKLPPELTSFCSHHVNHWHYLTLISRWTYMFLHFILLFPLLASSISKTP